MVEFRELDAVVYGDREAIMINYFRYWISKNKANNKHFYDGHYWTYNSVSAFKKVMPYWSEKQIRNIITSLIEKGVIMEGNYNKAGYDRTKWYAFCLEDSFLLNCPNGQMDFAKWANGFDQKGKPIPISNPVSNPIIFVPPSLEEIEEYCRERNNDVDAEKFINYYQSNGWRVGKNKMKDWKAAVRTWERNSIRQLHPSKPKSKYEGLTIEECRKLAQQEIAEFNSR